jgi:hypothetical protein
MPLATNDTADGRGRNRRVDVVIVNSLKLQSPQAAQKPQPAKPAASK